MGTRFRFSLVVVALEVQFWFPVWLLFLLDRGFTIGQAALIDGVFRFVAVIAEVPMGWFSDRWGRKFSLYAVLGGTVATFLLIATVTTFSGLVVAWVAWGILWALMSGLLTAYGWELGRAEGGREQDFVRIRRMAASVAMMISLVTAGFLYNVSVSLPFVVTAVLAALAVPFAVSLPAVDERERIQEGCSSSFVVLRRREMQLALLAGASVLVVGWSIQMVFQPLGIEAELGPAGISLMFAGFSSAQLVGAWLLGRITSPSATAVAGSLVGMALTCGGVWVGSLVGGGVVLQLVSLLMLGFFYSFSTTYCDIWVSGLSTMKNRATTLSVLSLLGGAVMVLTRPLLGLAAEQLGAAATFGLWGGVCGFLAIALWIVLRREPHPAVAVK